MEDFGSSSNIILENEYTSGDDYGSSEDESSSYYESVPSENGDLGGHGEQNESFFQSLGEVCILCCLIYYNVNEKIKMSS
jgi:hypothetical protein